MEILQGMYGLPQAGCLANDLLTKRLAAHGYVPAPIMPGLWLHKSRPILFTLVVDDFEIKYVNQANLDHFLAVLRLHRLCCSQLAQLLASLRSLVSR